MEQRPDSRVHHGWSRLATSRLRVPALVAGATMLMVGSYALVTGGATLAGAQPNPPGGALIVNNGSYATQGDLPAACASASYTTIQAAVNAASSGNSIYVCAGTYSGAVSISTGDLTLDGAEYGVNAVGRTGEPEAVIDGTGGVTFASGGTGATISGFSLNGYTGSTGEINAANVGSGWTFSDNIIDTSKGGIYFNTDDVASPAPTTISDNEFTQATAAGEGGGGYAGQAVALWGKTGNDVTISGNDFDNLSGPGAAINTTGSGAGPDNNCSNSNTATLSQGLDITSNTWNDNGANSTDENFIAMFCTDGAQVTDNTASITDNDDPNAETVIYLGGANDGAVVSGNHVSAVTDGGAYSQFTLGNTQVAGVDVNSNSYTSGAQGVTVSDNTVTGLNFGVEVRNSPPTNVAITGNTLMDSVTNGIKIKATGGDTISGNTAESVYGSDDCLDLTSGSGTASTNDTWSNDIGNTSSPAGLCQSATTATTSLSGASQSGTAITVPAGSAVTDSATLSGVNTATAGGSVTYTAYSDSDCSTSAGSGGTVSVTDGSVPPSSAVTLDSAGTYYWQASYTGDSANAASTSACGPGDEVETVAIGSTSLSTSLSGDSQSGTAISVPVNTAVTDAATLSGTYASIAGGTVTYTVYSDSGCSTPAGSGGTVNVTDGSVPASSAVTLASTGTYYWQASYSGDVANTSSTSACGVGDEVETVSEVTTTTQTTPSSSTGALGGPNSDVAVVQGDANGGSPTGTVTFYECGPTGTPTDCTSQAHQVGTPKTLTGEPGFESMATSSSFVANSTGYWCFAGYYSGSADYVASSDTAVDECYDVTSATTSLLTAPTNATINLGQTDTDAGTVTGNAAGGSPTGTMTFYECGPTSTPTTCSSMANQVGGAVNLTGGPSDTATASSAPFTPNAVGYWCFAGYYSGDSNYKVSSDATVDECVHVNGPLTIVTTSLPNATAGQSYSFGIVARGGTQPYRWSLNGGHLPRGMSFNKSTGVISGSPRRTGSFSFTVHVADSTRPHHERVLARFTLTVG